MAPPLHRQQGRHPEEVGTHTALNGTPVSCAIIKRFNGLALLGSVVDKNTGAPNGTNFWGPLQRYARLIWALPAHPVGLAGQMVTPGKIHNSDYYSATHAIFPIIARPVFNALHGSLSQCQFTSLNQQTSDRIVGMSILIA